MPASASASSPSAGSSRRRRFTEDASIDALAVQREGRAVTLRADKLERAVAIRALRDVGIQVEELENLAAVAWHFLDLTIIERARNHRLISLDDAGVRPINEDGFTLRTDFGLDVGANRFRAAEHGLHDRFLEPGGRYGDRVSSGL